MKKLILLLGLMINIHFCISQTGYPKEIVLDNTPLIAFTYNQVREINVGLEKGEGCKVLLDSNEKLIMTQDSLILTGKQLLANLEAQIQGYDKLVAWQDERYTIKEKQYQKSLKANKTNKTIFGIVIGTVGTIALGLFIYAVAH